MLRRDFVKAASLLGLPKVGGTPEVTKRETVPQGEMPVPYAGPPVRDYFERVKIGNGFLPQFPRPLFHPGRQTPPYRLWRDGRIEEAGGTYVTVPYEILGGAGDTPGDVRKMIENKLDLMAARLLAACGRDVPLGEGSVGLLLQRARRMLGCRTVWAFRYGATLVAVNPDGHLNVAPYPAESGEGTFRDRRGEYYGFAYAGMANLGGSVAAGTLA